MILVVGATGLVGSEICKRLIKRGEQIRALIRPTSAPDKVTALEELGVELSVGDLKDPESLAHACQGAEAVISTASCTFSRQLGDSIATVDEQGQLQLVEAAKAAGVERFVLVSFSPPAVASFPLAEAKARVEQAISGMNFTIIQASFFMELWLSPALGFDYTKSTARIYGAGTSQVSWVSFRDVAEMCAVALRHPSALKRTIEFGGPDALSPIEVLSRFERLTGRRFAVEHVPSVALLAQYQSAQDPMEKSFAGLMLHYDRGDAVPMASVAAEFGLKLTSVDEYAHAVLAIPAMI